MGFALNSLHYILVVAVLLPAVCYSYYPYSSSRATYYGSPDCLGTPTGACGYGEFGRTVNDAKVSGVSRLYRNGTGCGACYQVRCKSQHCNEQGTTIVVTDYGEGDRTDFILSERAYAALARPNMIAELFAFGVIDVEYQRVPCRYPGYNLMFKVHEHSRFPDYLAIVALYQTGINDILAVEIWQDDCKEWIPMRRAFGAVFDRANPPRGAITLRFQVSGSGGVKWVQATNVIPIDWKAGVAYNTAILLD